MLTIDELVVKAKADGASDIHLICGLPPKYRKDGDLQDMADEPLTHEDCEAYAKYLAKTDAAYNELLTVGELDLAGTFADNRCRLHIFMQQHEPSVALRLLREQIPDLNTLGLPPAALTLTDLHKGIVLVTGETGSGKSTTHQALVKLVRSGTITRETALHYAHDEAYVKKNAV